MQIKLAPTFQNNGNNKKKEMQKQQRAENQIETTKKEIKLQIKININKLLEGKSYSVNVSPRIHMLKS